MLKGDGLSFRYHSQQHWLLHNFDIEVAPGEIVGLLGPSGKGKTTLGKLLTGYLKPTAGKITLNGQPLPDHGYCPVQMIFQHPELAMNPRWRVRKIISEGQAASGELLESLCIQKSWLNRFIHEVSGGELQRIAVARVLNSRTRYLIADEMTAMLDANTQALIWQVVLEYVRVHGLGILVITHAQPLLERLCNLSLAGSWRHRIIHFPKA